MHTESIIKENSGYKPTLVRPPYKAFSRNSLDVADQLGYRFILWSIDTNDWANVSVEYIMKEVNKAKPGDIILLHDGIVPTQTVEALPLIIKTLRAKGLEPVTVSELLSESQVAIISPPR
jgi:peptidoglycan-N-acetylglucosamine deacetylase